MSYLIDTNIIAELRKAERCDPNVAARWASVGDDELFLSPLILGEIRKGVERARGRNPSRAAALAERLEQVTGVFADRILPVDTAVAEEWGRMSARRPVPVIDCLLAATAKVNGLTLVTGNEADVADLGAAVLNPFHAR